MKKHRTAVPDFSRAKPGSSKPLPGAAGAAGAKAPPVPAQRAKPPATSAKSGRRGT